MTDVNLQNTILTLLTTQRECLSLFLETEQAPEADHVRGLVAQTEMIINLVKNLQVKSSKLTTNSGACFFCADS